MADSNRNVKIVAAALALLLLLGGASAAVIVTNNDDDKDKPPKPGDCPSGYRWSIHDHKCVLADPGTVDPGGGKLTPSGDCPPGMIKNAAKLKAMAQFTGAQLEEELKKYPDCVPIQCPANHTRSAYGDCIPECPAGMSWSPAEGKCIPHPVNCPPGEQWSPALMKCMRSTPTPKDPGDNDDPKDIPSIIKTFPEGGNFYQVRFGDTFEGSFVKNDRVAIAHAYLQREAFLAAKEFGQLDDAKALAWAQGVAKPTKAYMQALEIILCAGSNDAAYGTYGYCGKRAKDAGKCKLPNGTYVQNHPGMHGRAIQLEPKHPNNVTRLLNGENLSRGVTLGNPGRAGDGSSVRVQSSFTSLPLLWMPLLDRAALWQSGGKTIGISSATWSDNTTKGWPPPIVVDRGIGDFANTGRTSWGCMKMEMSE